MIGSDDDMGIVGTPGKQPPHQWIKVFDATNLLLMQGAHHGFGGISGAVRFSGAGPADAAEVEAVRSSALALFDAKLRGDAAAETWLLNGEISRATKDGMRFTWLSKQ